MKKRVKERKDQAEKCKTNSLTWALLMRTQKRMHVPTCS